MMIAKITGKRNGHHVHSQVFMGEDVNHLALNGDLTFTVGEWQIFVASLMIGAKQSMGHLKVIVNDPLEKSDV